MGLCWSSKLSQLLRQVCQNIAALKGMIPLANPMAHRNGSKTVSYFVCRPWWLHRKDISWDHGVGLFVISTDPDSLLFQLTRSRVRRVVNAAERIELTVTAEDWTDPGLEELLLYFERSGIVAKYHREVVAGFLLHPMYLRKDDTPKSVERITPPSSMTQNSRDLDISTHHSENASIQSSIDQSPNEGHLPFVILPRNEKRVTKSDFLRSVMFRAGWLELVR